MVLFCIILLLILIYIFPLCVCLTSMDIMSKDLQKEIRKYSYYPVINVLFSFYLVSLTWADKYTILRIKFNGKPLNMQEFNVTKTVFFNNESEIVMEINIYKTEDEKEIKGKIQQNVSPTKDN